MTIIKNCDPWLYVLQICSPIIIFAPPDGGTGDPLNVAPLAGAALWASSLALSVGAAAFRPTGAPVFPRLPHFSAPAGPCARLEKVEDF